ncbi:hypothetical protein SEA_MOLLYMUR_104 [Gordonia phage Mollymur]|uniref:Uncharacterized protein n=1 Tax=Gordonia phage Mollymur TaxID=2590895 RepID=A0A4Y6EJH4_9CAUD|nr:hypothetical protein PQB84_gp022 [Gordonia phage Mollymur]QDF15464.1 hypothetical protein SEA_MOLLYMUR_104 [Gordonia phage Mollymur]
METVCDEWPRARTKHRCQFCGRTIDPGELYRRQFNKDGGDVWTWKNCAHCDATADILDLHYDYADEGITSEQFADAEPGNAREEYLLECWRAQWRFPSGRLMPVPSRKD